VIQARVMRRFRVQHQRPKPRLPRRSVWPVTPGVRLGRAGGHVRPGDGDREGPSGRVGTPGSGAEELEVPVEERACVGSVELVEQDAER